MSFLFVALDSSLESDVKGWVSQLDDLERVFGYKVNLDFIIKNGPRAISRLTTDRPIFADVKMWNGVRTMTSVCRELQDVGVSLVNAYTLAGSEMLSELVESVKGIVPPIRVLGLTILTHYDDDYSWTYFGRSTESMISNLIDTAEIARLHGVILPGRFLHLMRGRRLVSLVPAVRPSSYVEKRKDQKQTTEVRKAVLDGADFLVCGSPITKAQDPRIALERILDEMRVAKQP